MSEERDGPAARGWIERPWIVIGAGRLGRALGCVADRLDVELRATWNRSEEAAGETADVLAPRRAYFGSLPEGLEEVDWRGAVVWLTVVDDAVADVAGSLADVFSGAALVLHTSGSLGLELFEDTDLAEPYGSLHPLLAVTDPEAAARRFGDVVWSVEGSGEAVSFAEAFTSALDAELVELPPGTRPLYHASAVTASNLVVALVDAALEMAEQTGLTREEARGMLLPLIASSVENLADQSTERALSGPVQRGDEEPIRRHLAALSEQGKDLEAIYRILTERARSLVPGGDED